MKKILINILTHGNEFVGERVADLLRERYAELIGAGIDIQIANEHARAQKIRYIDHDLNRVFPGNPNGSYEEKRAHELSRSMASYELVIDVHSTESGSGDMIIVTKLDQATKAAVAALAPKYCIYMNIKPDRSLISCAKVGIAFEMGSDADSETADKTFLGIEYLLSYMQLIPTHNSLGHETLYFEVFSQVPKPVGARLRPTTRNFELVQKGETFAEKADGTPIIADQDFYPIIFGNSNYETIFGFAARSLDNK